MLTRSPRRICFARQVHFEIDRAHDAVAEFFVDECLEGGAVRIDQFLEAVDQRVGGADVGGGLLQGATCSWVTASAGRSSISLMVSPCSALKVIRPSRPAVTTPC